MANNSMEQFMVKNMTTEDISTFISFQKIMAKETEGVNLDDSSIAGALEYLINDDSYGKAFMAKLGPNGVSVGTCYINYGYDVLSNKFTIWVQSVFVHPEYRKKGIFSKIFNHLELVARQLNASRISLFVDFSNLPAQKVYEKMGMVRREHSFIERDFFFDHKVENIRNPYDYKFELKALKRFNSEPLDIYDLLRQFQLNELSDIEVYNDPSLFNWLDESFCALIKKNDRVVGIFVGFVEISDWRNGLNAYIIDYAYDKENTELLPLIRKLEYEITTKPLLGLLIKCVRFIFEGADTKRTELELVGYENEHYYIYDKNVKYSI